MDKLNKNDIQIESSIKNLIKKLVLKVNQIVYPCVYVLKLRITA
jgi:hypothetical protein